MRKTGLNLLAPNGNYLENVDLFDDSGAILRMLNHNTQKVLSHETSLDEITKYTSNWINIKTLGADSTGVKDCTQIVQDALNNYNNIYFPEGKFLIGNVIIPDKELHIKGDYKSTVIIVNGVNCFEKKLGYKLITFDNISFLISNGGHAIHVEVPPLASGVIHTLECNHCYFEGKARTEANKALFIKGTSNTQITDCTFYLVNGIYQIETINAIITNCVFRSCYYGIYNNGIGATAYSCGTKVIGCTALECMVGIKVVTNDYITISNCMIDYNLFGVIMLGQGLASINNCYISSKDGNPPVYIADDLATRDGFLNGNGSTEVSQHIVLTNCDLYCHVEINYDSANINYSGDCLQAFKVSNLTMIGGTCRFYSRYGAYFEDCSLVTMSDVNCARNNLITYTTDQDLATYAVYGKKDGSITNYDSQNFQYRNIKTTDKILRYLATMLGMNNSSYVSENFGAVTITAGNTSATVTTGLKTPIKSLTLTPNKNTPVFYSNKSNISTFVINIPTALATDVEVCWYAKC